MRQIRLHPESGIQQQLWQNAWLTGSRKTGRLQQKLISIAIPTVWPDPLDFYSAISGHGLLESSSVVRTRLTLGVVCKQSISCVIVLRTWHVELTFSQ